MLARLVALIVIIALLPHAAGARMDAAGYVVLDISPASTLSILHVRVISQGDASTTFLYQRSDGRLSVPFLHFVNPPAHANASASDHNVAVGPLESARTVGGFPIYPGQDIKAVVLVAGDVVWWEYFAEDPGVVVREVARGPVLAVDAGDFENGARIAAGGGKLAAALGTFAYESAGHLIGQFGYDRADGARLGEMSVAGPTSQECPCMMYGFQGTGLWGPGIYEFGWDGASVSSGQGPALVLADVDPAALTWTS